MLYVHFLFFCDVKPSAAGREMSDPTDDAPKHKLRNLFLYRVAFPTKTGKR